MSYKTVLITGCSAGGVGSSLAYSFHASGYTIFATARSPSKVDDALAALPRVRVLALDVSDPAQITEVADQVTSYTKGRLDVLVNNAGANYTTPVLDADIQQSKELFDTNFWGTIQVCQAFAPLLIEAKGSVVNISSIAGVLNTPWMGIYSASKAAVALVSETLRLEFAPFGVKVLTVMSGNIDTRFWGNESSFSLPSGSLYEPVAAVIADAASGKMSGRKSAADEFARGIVSAVEKRASGPTWKGALAGTIRWVANFIPVEVLDKVLSSGRGLDQLAKLWSQGNTKT